MVMEPMNIPSMEEQTGHLPAVEPATCNIRYQDAGRLTYRMRYYIERGLGHHPAATVGRSSWQNRCNMLWSK